MTRAIFLDRDGVLNEDKTGYPHKSEHLFLAPNAKEGMKVLAEMDFLLFLFTNQSGVGQGIFSEEDFHTFTQELLRQVGSVHDVFACFHTRDDKCECRKPSPKMIHDAAEKHNVDLSQSYVVGDQDRDIEAGRKAGCRTVFIQSGGFGTGSSFGNGADYIAKDLLDAAEWIRDDSSA